MAAIGIGQRSGLLTVQHVLPGRIQGNITYQCLCDCGNTKVVTGANITKVSVKSCGCLQPPSKVIANGSIYSYLTVIDRVENNKIGNKMYDCLCQCGKRAVAKGLSLNNGDVVSCGCFRHSGDAQRTHGECGKTVEYGVWGKMKGRCNNVKNKNYHRYGGRGIKVCDRWLDSFEMFLVDMGRRPSNKHQIDRKDNDGDYCPSNCRWVTSLVNNRNRSNNNMIDSAGDVRTLSTWLEDLGIPSSTYKSRRKRGLSPLQALGLVY